jgi:uncharacterized membrane protein
MTLSKFKSRKFWIAVAGGLLVILNDQFGWGIDEAALTQMVTVVVGYIAGQGVVDAVAAKADAEKYASYTSAVAYGGTWKMYDGENFTESSGGPSVQ